MRRDVQEIFRAVSGNKQVMMFSATLSKDIRLVCKKFMQNVSASLGIIVDIVSRPQVCSTIVFSKQPLEIYVDDETKLTLHGLQQHYVKLAEAAKNRKLNDLLDSLEFNQVRLGCPDQMNPLLTSPFAGRHFRQVRQPCDTARCSP